MKSILFIIPSLTTGGTNSSLDALYEYLHDKYCVSVFSISHCPHNHSYSFDEALFPQNKTLSYSFSNYSDQRGFDKIKAAGYKILRSLSKIIHFDWDEYIEKRAVLELQRIHSFDVVVGFQEGLTTRMVSFFDSAYKIAWIHCNYDAYLDNGLSEESVYTLYDKIVCVSNFTSSVFCYRYPALANKVVTVYNLINRHKILELGDKSIDDSRFYKVKNTLLTVGRFSAVKRFREIPAVARSLKKKGIQFMWYVIGPGSDSEESSSFLENLQRYDVKDCVKWLEEKANPYPYFKASDIYVCMSETEACPMVFKEAQLFGLPIVTTDFPSSFEFVNNDNGDIVPLDRIDDAIIRMIKRIENGWNAPLDDNSNKIIFESISNLFTR